MSWSLGVPQPRYRCSLQMTSMFWAMKQECLQCRSAGKQMEWDGNHYTIEELTKESFEGVDIALFSAGGSISRKFAPLASDAGCTVS